MQTGAPGSTPTYARRRQRSKHLPVSEATRWLVLTSPRVAGFEASTEADRRAHRTVASGAGVPESSQRPDLPLGHGGGDQGPSPNPRGNRLRASPARWMGWIRPQGRQWCHSPARTRLLAFALHQPATTPRYVSRARDRYGPRVVRLPFDSLLPPPLPRDLSSVDFTSRRPNDHLRQMNDLGHLGLPQVVLVWRTLGLLICCTG
jgi:hypothetical protein